MFLSFATKLKQRVSNLWSLSKWPWKYLMLPFHLAHVSDLILICCRKRYDRAEKEFLDAKLLLYKKLERKELLTHHLCTIIEQNEMRKAKKLSELMEKLEMPDTVSSMVRFISIKFRWLIAEFLTIKIFVFFIQDASQAVEESSVKQSESSTTESKRKISSEIILTPTSVLPQFEAGKGQGIKISKQDEINLNWI